jgi:glycine/D-amino acid oxidase-like deaminating enzyme
MNLHSNYPFWLTQNGLISSYPALEEDIKTDIVILGAGITGALAAYYLTNAGFEVTVVDKRHVGMGSTAASTALLQYEIDYSLTELAAKRGFDNALESYKTCLKAIDTLADIAKHTGNAHFKKRVSLQYASNKKDAGKLLKEYTLRKANDIPVEWLTENEIKNRFQLSAPGGILSAIAAQLDPYTFTHNLMKYVTAKGNAVYDATEITSIRHHANKIALHTKTGNSITAKYLVMATGYESGKYLHKHVEQLTSTYAIISKPLPAGDLWFKNALIWETARPYIYLRTTNDNRIIIGGKDDDFSGKTLRDANLDAKSQQLLAKFNKLMPSIPFVMDFAWTGVFGSTKDGLPYIGKIKDRKNTFFTLGYGGNGIVFSTIAAEIITDMISGKTNEGEKLFSFYR